MLIQVANRNYLNKSYKFLDLNVFYSVRIIIPKTVTAEIAAAERIMLFFFSCFFVSFILAMSSFKFTFLLIKFERFVLFRVIVLIFFFHSALILLIFKS